MTYQIGDVVADQFKIRDVHEGGFSTVLIVEDHGSAPQALKMIRRDLLDSARDKGKVQEQFQRECNLWGERLRDCPHVATAKLSFGSFHGLGPVLFMEAVEGPSLARLRPGGGRLSISQTARLGEQIAEAMAFAHAVGVLHRDLKPSNVLLTRKNEVKLVDWGLAGVQEVAGYGGYTKGYASPQRETTPSLADPKDDVFSFGVVLFECLTGKLPDPRAGGEDLKQKLRAAEPMLPEALLRLIAATLDLSPDKRPPFAQIWAAICNQELRADVARREVELPFCSHCDFVSIERIEHCPICGEPCRRRVSRLASEGMARIPAGTYTRGLSVQQVKSAFLAAGHAAEEKHVQQLATDEPKQAFLPAFDLDVLPVTNADFEQFCKATHYPEPEGFAANKIAFPDHPVVDITWKDALCYALWKGKRLPSAAEWEKAARGDRDARSYPWGDVWEPERCNNNRNPYKRSTTEVTAFTQPPRDGRSPFGVADMVGNVREWLSEGRQFGVRSLAGGSWTDGCILEGLIGHQVDAEVDFHDKATGFRCASDIVYEQEVIAVSRHKEETNA
ncbi:MAG: hypothetical protein QOF89_4481 [Acidobacteriota bacterium]|jgi:formylglycine-generating enzyme required for sulfatase activity|nr:hypothetical protein [Acidobacteriota bacterium]